MKFDKLSFSPLFEKTLVRFISEFSSEMSPSRVCSELSKALKKNVSVNDPGSYNINLKYTNEKVFIVETAFMTYRDSRLTILNLFKWIERKGSAEKNHNFYVDIKFIDKERGPFKGTLFNSGVTIEKIDKLKMILDFQESKVYDEFPSRRYGFNSKSVLRFEPNQMFIPKEDSPVDPRFYSIPNTSDKGINFETLNQGFLRLQYIGGKDYIKKSQAILDIISEFCVSAWNCVVNSGYSKENIASFEKIVSRQRKIRESFVDYLVFSKNFPTIKFTVDLVDNPKTLYSYYQVLRERIYDLLINIEFKGEFELNYDTSISVLQIKEAKLKVNSISNVDFIMCEIEFGSLLNCDIYESKLTDVLLEGCNLFHNTEANRCKLINSFTNRTTLLTGCEFEGENGVLNGEMKSGVFRSGSIGVHANISSDTIVIQYRELKPGYFVAGDKVIIPTKKFNIP